MGDCLFMRRGAVHTAPLLIKSAFADNTWAEVVLACQKNKVPETWNVGDQLSMTINGVEYKVDIIGKSHDNYADGSGKAPLTFQLHDCYGTILAMNNSQVNTGGWRDSVMRKIHLPNILSLMPLEVQNAIKEVKKVASAGAQSNSLYTTSDKLFLLSEVEVFGTNSGANSGEGKQYEYYQKGNSKVKKVKNTMSVWWERSPDYGSPFTFRGVATAGTAYWYYANHEYGVSFAFCF